MIFYAIESKLATLRTMNNSGDIDYITMDVILGEILILTRVISAPTTYKVEKVGERAINVKIACNNFRDDGTIIEF